MVRSFKALAGMSVRATDGRFGLVSDVYFDDAGWRVKYCLVDTGRWLRDRYVLISVRSLSVVDFARQELWVRLSKSQIARSPGGHSDLPVSKQDVSGARALLRRRFSSRGPTAAHDPHLRSCRAVSGHQLRANDGTVGRVEDFLIDVRWVVRDLVVIPENHRMPEKARVVVSTAHVSAISWPDAVVSVDLPEPGLLEHNSLEQLSTRP